MAHHIWCNYFMRPEKGCKMCEGLRKEYPEDVSSSEMMKKYFPENIVISSICDDCDPIDNPGCNKCIGS